MIFYQGGWMNKEQLKYHGMKKAKYYKRTATENEQIAIESYNYAVDLMWPALDAIAKVIFDFDFKQQRSQSEIVSFLRAVLIDLNKQIKETNK
jgi:hypothetical protein